MDLQTLTHVAVHLTCSLGARPYHVEKKVRCRAVQGRGGTAIPRPAEEGLEAAGEGDLVGDEGGGRGGRGGGLELRNLLLQVFLGRLRDRSPAAALHRPAPDLFFNVVGPRPERASEVNRDVCECL